MRGSVDPDEVKKLIAVFKRHVPSLVDGDERWVGEAEAFIFNTGMGSAYFGFSTTASNLKELAPLLRKIRKILEDIPEGHQKMLNACSHRALTGAQQYSFFPSSAMLEACDLLLAGIPEARKKFDNQDSIKIGSTNWMTAACAHNCRILWAKNAINRNDAPRWVALLRKSRWQEGDPPEDHPKSEFIREFAPLTENAAPGPFGRFLKDTIEALSLPGSAASGLAAVPDWAFDVAYPPGSARENYGRNRR